MIDTSPEFDFYEISIAEPPEADVKSADQQHESEKHKHRCRIVSPESARPLVAGVLCFFAGIAISFSIYLYAFSGNNDEPPTDVTVTDGNFSHRSEKDCGTFYQQMPILNSRIVSSKRSKRNGRSTTSGSYSPRNVTAFVQSRRKLNEMMANVEANSDRSTGANHRILGGSQASIDNFPWQVSIWIKDSRFLNGEPQIYCGGSILTSKWILTAAHCFEEGADPVEIFVVAGVSKLSESDSQKAQKIAVTKMISHYFDLYTYEKDVILLQLEEELTYTAQVQPICLPSDSFDYFNPNITCYISGWGSTDAGGTIYPDELNFADVTVFPREICNQPTWLGEDVKEDMLCAGHEDGGIDACAGDSGGPLACLDLSTKTWVLAGVVSWGYSCGAPQLPGVYANTSYFRSWINDVIYHDVDDSKSNQSVYTTILP